MKWSLLIICLLVLKIEIKAQSSFATKLSSLKKIEIDSGVVLSIDEPSVFTLSEPTKIIVYALPNGNTTEQTFGKKLAQGDDWHFDIQHIGAQTQFIRNADQKSNYIVVYVENSLKSWPAWRRKYANSDAQIGEFVSSLMLRYKNFNPQVILSGHSGGGSFIFGYINSQAQIPTYVERIGFLDATYGYETEKHQAKLKTWLKAKNKSLQVIAYNDSVVVYNGKPLVSPTGGTWYRSKLIAKDLQSHFKLKSLDIADRLGWFDKKHRIDFKLIKNPEGKIYHTVLVEKNGFIDLVFNGTAFQDKGYKFWDDRVYTKFILQ
ncbi:hypothetical protein EZ428_14475 [Pedobacter frigiditerrae]|uniref:Esterase n=1 Tax=Pedobacter frigiditerrae TaxID=2530452 RepID=A0A4R0MTS7_9SPHI|nr:hypothetical protein [Pedobacter frigiditerrae]TCC90475.1 hypothetical protein EZ428_14475 [Pedobacter frigiditerrae]